MNMNLHSTESFMGLLQQERARVHRSGGKFALILFRLSDTESARTAFPLVLPAMKKRLRSIDQVGTYDDSHIGLLLPHTAGDGARKIAEDLNRIPAIASHLGGCEVYVYP